jgi:enamine deaminase RidA (YjgF/YER057c/UK114 family)
VDRGNAVRTTSPSFGRTLVAILFGSALSLAPAQAFAQARAEAIVLMPSNPAHLEFQEAWGFSDAVITGDTIYVSGAVVGNKRPGETDFAPAFDRVYRQIGAILERAGASWDDVVDLTSYHTDVDGQIEDLVSVHKSYVKAPYPAWTAIGVAKILDNGIAEIKVVARRASSPQ